MTSASFEFRVGCADRGFIHGQCLGQRDGLIAGGVAAGKTLQEIEGVERKC